MSDLVGNPKYRFSHVALKYNNGIKIIIIGMVEMLRSFYIRVFDLLSVYDLPVPVLMKRSEKINLTNVQMIQCT